MGIMAMEWLVALIAITAAIGAVVLWISSRPDKAPDRPVETPANDEHPTGFLRFQPPTRDDVFQCSSYYSALAKKRMLIWDYRDKRGTLHSGVAPTLEEATAAASEFGYSAANGNHNNSITA